MGLLVDGAWVDAWYDTGGDKGPLRPQGLRPSATGSRPRANSRPSRAATICMSALPAPGRTGC